MRKSGDITPAWLPPVVLGATTLGLAVALMYLAVIGVRMIFVSTTLVGTGFGIGVVLLAGVGAWTGWATVRNGIALQRISMIAQAQGCEVDISDLPRRPSGRIDRDAADILFEQVKAQYRQSPRDWQSNYRLARAYDFAGDRARGREFMRKAIELEQRQPGPRETPSTEL